MFKRSELGQSQSYQYKGETRVGLKEKKKKTVILPNKSLHALPHPPTLKQKLKIHSMERQNSIMLKSIEGSQAAFTVTASAAYCVNLSRLLNLSMPQSPLF